MNGRTLSSIWCTVFFRFTSASECSLHFTDTSQWVKCTPFYFWSIMRVRLITPDPCCALARIHALSAVNRAFTTISWRTYIQKYKSILTSLPLNSHACCLVRLFAATSCCQTIRFRSTSCCLACLVKSTRCCYILAFFCSGIVLSSLPLTSASCFVVPHFEVTSCWLSI